MGNERLYHKNVKIDDRNRVVLRSELLEELKLKCGDFVCVYADFENNQILIKRSEKKCKND